jgi:hypothetical protein
MAAVRNFMSLEEKETHVQLYGPTPCLVKEKGAIVRLEFMSLLSQPRPGYQGTSQSYWWWRLSEGVIL